MKEQIIKKAWKISIKDLSEPWYFEEVYVNCETRGEARSKGLTEMRNLGAEKLKESRYDSSEINYTDIIAHRVKDYDIILFEGEEMKRHAIEKHIWCKERDQKALDLTVSNPNDLAVVWAGCYGSYWGANQSGYSDDIIFAGKYKTLEAYEIVRGSDYGRQETARLLNVEEFNSNIDNEVEKLQKQIDRLITYKI
jgi:hypothetical protein|nr:MAG TPA: hypothetical protein [Caudoviricetes sp.]